MIPMTSNLNDLKKNAIRDAMRIRKAIGCNSHETFCVFDAAIKLGLDVRFLALDSVDGFACRSDPPTIILTSRRPELRRRFTCAHELGHLALKHEAEADLVSASVASNKRPEIELLADLFAGQLLMPKLLLSSGFAALADPYSPLQIFELACSIGVGLNTLLTHAQRTAKLIEAKQASKYSIEDVRKELKLVHPIKPLIAVGKDWANRPIDLDVGTYIHISSSLYDKSTPPPLCDFVQSTPHGNLFVAKQVGCEEAQPQSIRVMPAEFVGRSIYRHTE